jgi:hypothetical protein
LHLLQIIDAARGTMDMDLLCDKARVLGHRGPRVVEIIDWLSMAKIDREPGSDGVSYIPLIRCYASTSRCVWPKHCPVHDNLKVVLTVWGRYHLHTLIYQRKYWKYLLYSMPLPVERVKNWSATTKKSLIGISRQAGGYVDHGHDYSGNHYMGTIG